MRIWPLSPYGGKFFDLPVLHLNRPEKRLLTPFLSDL
jgi:hypothetical protein